MAVGPDNVPGFLIRDCSYIFVKPLKMIFNLFVITTRHLVFGNYRVLVQFLKTEMLIMSVIVALLLL